MDIFSLLALTQAYLDQLSSCLFINCIYLFLTSGSHLFPIPTGEFGARLGLGSREGSDGAAGTKKHSSCHLWRIHVIPPQIWNPRIMKSAATVGFPVHPFLSVRLYRHNSQAGTPPTLFLATSNSCFKELANTYAPLLPYCWKLRRSFFPPATSF